MAAKVKIPYFVVRRGVSFYVLDCPDLEMKIKGSSVKEVVDEFYNAIPRYFNGVATVNSIKRQKKENNQWMLVSLT